MEISQEVTMMMDIPDDSSLMSENLDLTFIPPTPEPNAHKSPLHPGCPESPSSPTLALAARSHIDYVSALNFNPSNGTLKDHGLPSHPWFFKSDLPTARIKTIMKRNGSVSVREIIQSTHCVIFL